MEEGTTAALPKLRDVAEAVLKGNWRTGERARDGMPFAYTAPSPTTYPWQWYWDSCLVAIARRHVDPIGARQELESLLRAARDDGFIGHTIFWSTPVTRTRRTFYNVQRRSDEMTRTIQPPLLAWAWQIVVGDPAQNPDIVRHHRRVRQLRDLENDGLIWIVQPDESGLDASPQFDAVWGRRAQGRPLFAALVHRNRGYEFDARRIDCHGGPVVCEPLTNTLHGLSQLALGEPSVTPALVNRLWDSREGLFRLDARPRLQSAPAVTWAALAPLALPDLPNAIADELIHRHLFNPKQFWTPVGPPSVALDDPSYRLNDTFHGLRRYWRGPTWVNAAWLVWLGLQRLGEHGKADALSSGIIQAVRREGCREYYNPFTGAGMGARDFAWTTLALDMQAKPAGAARSYIPRRGAAGLS